MEMMVRMMLDVEGYSLFPFEENLVIKQPPGNLEGYVKMFAISDEQLLEWVDLLYFNTSPLRLSKLEVWPTDPPSSLSRKAGKVFDGRQAQGGGGSVLSYNKYTLVTYNTVINVFGKSRISVDEDGVQQDSCDQIVKAFGQLARGIGRPVANDTPKSVELLCILDLFQEMIQQGVKLNVVIYSTVTDGFSESGQFAEGLHSYEDMRSQRVQIDRVCYNKLNSKYVKTGKYKEIARVCTEVEVMGIENDTMTYNPLINGYGEQDKFDGVCHLIQAMRERKVPPSVLPYLTLIDIYSKTGMSGDAANMFLEFKGPGLQVDVGTYGSFMDTLSKNGLVEDGLKYFSSIYAFEQNVQHYCCLVDLYGRSGIQDQATEVIRKMLVKPNSDVWGALLNSCKIHGNSLLGEVAGTRLIELEPSTKAGLVIFEAARSITELSCVNNWQLTPSIKVMKLLLYLVLVRDIHDAKESDLMLSVTTWVSVILVGMQIGEFSPGKFSHGFAIKCEVLDDEVMIPTWVSIYACVHDWYSAKKLFKLTPKKHLGARNAMLFAYTEVCVAGEACGVLPLKLFAVMPDEVRLPWWSILVAAAIGNREIVNCLLNARMRGYGAVVEILSLTLQIPLEHVPPAQQGFVKVCKQLYKPVIVAFQLFESMIEYPMPTRAAVAAVFEEVVQRADALMLSGESAMGQYPFSPLAALLVIYVGTNGVSYSYTWWTFTLITFYFGLSSLVFVYGCYQWRTMFVTRNTKEFLNLHLEDKVLRRGGECCMHGGLEYVTAKTQQGNTIIQIQKTMFDRLEE